MAGVPLGVTTPTTLANGQGGEARQSVYHTATYGWYAQPTFNFGSRLFVSPGIRFDGGSASGPGNTMNIFPKTDVSYLAVDPEHPLFGKLTMVRPRIAFGISGVQPGPAEALRLFNVTNQQTIFLPSGVAGTPQSVITLYGLGNTNLHPERSRELEGGIDLGFGNDRLTVTLTGYNKTRYDAIEAIPVAPSVAGGAFDGSNQQIAKNIGNIRNTGFEATISARLLDSPNLGWSVNANWGTDRNRVVSLLPGQLPLTTVSSPVTRVTPGYPLFGFWAKPISAYSDENSDGVIEPSEVRLADSLVYMGAPYPDYTMALSTTVTLLNGRLSINTGGDYTSGLTQYNGSANFLQLLVNNPASTPIEQANVAGEYLSGAGVATTFDRFQTVNTLRWTSLSINYIVSPTIAHRFRASSMSIALQGSNLGLHTNYHGKDPDVNAYATGNQSMDTGQLPQPRTWSLRVSLGD
jgi:hypothetical protein